MNPSTPSHQSFRSTYIESNRDTEYLYNGDEKMFVSLFPVLETTTLYRK